MVAKQRANMKTIQVAISELEFSKFRLSATSYSFSELLDIVSRELSRQKLAESIALSEQYGLSKISMADITKEVKAVRNNAKNRN